MDKTADQVVFLNSSFVIRHSSLCTMSANAIQVFPGAFHLPGYLNLEEQRRLFERCREIGSQPAGFYVPTVRYGAKMRIQMVCLGLHWNARTYRYETRRSDFDGLPVQPLPDDLKALAGRV